MSWLTPTWLIVASACVTLAAIHARVWFHRREARANAAFAVVAISVAAIAFIELGMFRATTLAEYGRMLWLNQFPVWSGLIAIVVFVRLYLHAGIAWLGWTAIGLRTLALVINLFSSSNINFRELHSLEKVNVFGDAVTVAQGVPNPWIVVGHLSLVVLLLFVATAARDLWRRGDRSRAVFIGGGLFLFIAAGGAVAISHAWGFAKVPSFLTPFFLPIVIVMALELSLDVVRTAQLSDQLSVKDEELRGSEEKLTLAADAANAGLWSIARGSGQLWATPRALAMFGLAADERHSISDVLRLIHDDDRERVRRFIDGAARAERTGAIEYRVVGPGGEVRWLASHGSAHRGGTETSPDLMGVTIDITDRKRTEDEAEQQRLQLERLSRMATLNELSGALAHELNQPLAIIMSNAEAGQRLLDDSSPDLAEIRAILGDIVDADERAGEVIKRLRGLLKGDAPKRELVSLNEIVQGVLLFMRADLVRRGVNVEVELDPELPRVSADRVPIEQVLVNLIGNACDAMALNAPGDRLLQIKTRASENAAQVTVVDAGSGLPTNPERLFDAFYTTKSEGLGLGLAISKSIVTAHAGRLSAAANAGRGATFTIELPLAREAT